MEAHDRKDRAPTAKRLLRPRLKMTYGNSATGGHPGRKPGSACGQAHFFPHRRSARQQMCTRQAYSAARLHCSPLGVHVRLVQHEGSCWRTFTIAVNVACRTPGSKRDWLRNHSYLWNHLPVSVYASVASLLPCKCLSWCRYILLGGVLARCLVQPHALSQRLHRLFRPHTLLFFFLFLIFLMACFFFFFSPLPVSHIFQCTSQSLLMLNGLRTVGFLFSGFDKSPVHTP